MKFNIKTVDRVCLVVICLIAVSLGYWTLNNRMNDREKKNRDKAIYSGISNNLSNVQKDLEYLTSMRDKKKKILDLLKKRIPDTPEAGFFLKTIDKSIRDNNLELISVNPQTPMEEGPYSRIPVQIVLRGGFKKIYGLVHDLETMERLIVVEKLKVERTFKDKDCRAELTAAIFSLTQPPSGDALIKREG